MGGLGRAFPVQLGDPHRLGRPRERCAERLGAAQQTGDLGRVGDRHVQRGGGGGVGVGDRQGMEGEYVEVGRFRAGRTSGTGGTGETQHRGEEGQRRHPPHAGGFAVGSHPGGDHQVIGGDPLDAGVEGVEQLPVEKRREGRPATFLDDPLGLQVAGQVRLVPGLEVADEGQRRPRLPRVGKAPVVTMGERFGERPERRGARRPAAGVRVRPAARGFGERGRVGDHQDRRQPGRRRAADRFVQAREVVGGVGGIGGVEAGSRVG